MEAKNRYTIARYTRRTHLMENSLQPIQPMIRERIVGEFFLAYEKKLIQNGYSSMEATYAVTSMQVELGLVKLEQLDKATVDELQKYIYVVMPMDIRSILKSLGVKPTTVKLHQS